MCFGVCENTLPRTSWPKFTYVIQNVCEDIVLGWQPRTTRKYVFFCPHHSEGTKSPGKQVYNMFWWVVTLRHTLTCITTRLYLHVCTCIYMSTGRSGCSPHTVKPWWKFLRILCHVFIRKMYGLLLSSLWRDQTPNRVGNPPTYVNRSIGWRTQYMQTPSLGKVRVVKNWDKEEGTPVVGPVVSGSSPTRFYNLYMIEQ